MAASRSTTFFAKNSVPVLLLLLLLTGMGLAQPVQATHAQSAKRAVSGHPHVLKTRAYQASHKAGISVPQLTYQGGPVMRASSKTYAIFWLPSTLQDGSATQVSATYVSLITRYFGDIGGSGLYNTATQYYDTGGSIVNSSSLGGVWIDTSPYPVSDCQDTTTPANCMSDAQFQTEVTKAMQVNSWSGGLSNLFFVFTSAGEGSCFDTSSSACAFTQYCAYHNYFQTSAGQDVLYANMPYTGTALSACGISASPNNDANTDSTINVVSHEHMEAVTDPLLNAWYDSQGNEIGDKCAWNFGNINLDGNQANVQWNSNYYLVQQEWSNADTGCALSWKPNVSSSALFSGSSDGNMYALNVADGTRLWSYKTGGAINSSLALVGANVYFSSNDGYLYALKTSNGSLLWRAKLNGAPGTSPVAVGGMIYVGSSNGFIYAFNQANGALRWRFTTIGRAATSMPVVANQMLYFSTSNGYIYALNANYGWLWWRDLARNMKLTQPVIDTGIVYASTTSGSLFALRAYNGSQLWRYSTSNSVAFGAPVVAGGIVYMGASDQYVYAISKGKLLWRYKTGGKINARPTFNNGVVYAGSDDDYLYALNGANGVLDWRFQAQGFVRTSPAISGEEVFFGSDDHTIYALTVAGGTSIWQYTTGGTVDSSPSVALITGGVVHHAF